MKRKIMCDRRNLDKMGRRQVTHIVVGDTAVEQLLDGNVQKLQSRIRHHATRHDTSAML